MQLGIGSPPQKITVLLDTGSSDLVVPQTGSAICRDKQQQCTANKSKFSTGSFDRAKSAGITDTRSPPLNATFQNGVQLQGSIVKAALTMGNQSVDGIMMGIVTKGTLPPGEALFPIFGVGPKQGEGIAKPYQNVPAAIKDIGATNANVFGVYLNDFRGNDGSIVFGGVDKAKFQGKLQAAPILVNDNGQIPSFVVDFSSVKLISGNGSAQGAQSTDLTPQGRPSFTLIDSGNPTVLISTKSVMSLSKALGSTFNKRTGNVGNVPCSMAQEGLSMSFGFNADNAIIQVPLELMMTSDQSSGNGDCALPIFATDSDTGSLGAPFMQAAYVVFDMDQKQLLMAQAVLNATESRIEEYNPTKTSKSSKSSKSSMSSKVCEAQ
ncbi:acid protease [Didymella exigua CBS 183.55]|uniref:Acid protease n=1 Tax=Didymella exigua CBS 183.55 TaxID=1150837 RepID=A0A6A5R2T7_9PLEO|nr:acid protease [Didymella exigua CBS 183.55]KAF1922375.1 acid protease [Didymella exigua CBS 183.55]